MELRRPDGPLDAFFAPVRRRHPDVDIVVLPRPEPTAARQPMDDAQVDAALDRVAAMADRVWTAAVGATTATPARWRFGVDEGTVVASARASATTLDGSGVLAALRWALEGEGWRVRRLPGQVARLSGVRGDLRVQASCAESTGALLLEVRSEPMYVGLARARRLARR
jgi:hypothetical protein